MNNFLRLFLSNILILFTIHVFGQETCNNGIDDDGDGLIDCFDSDCSNHPDCDSFFFGNSVTCSDQIQVPTFAMRREWASANQTATSHASPVVGDLDGNGIPEIVSVNSHGPLQLFVLNGATGQTIASTNIGFIPENTPAIADIDRNGIGEIIVSENMASNVAMYNVDVNTKNLIRVWRKQASKSESIGVIGIADFDGDGDVEIYYRNEIMNAIDGSVLIPGDANGNWSQSFITEPIVADILADNECADCAGLELITGNEVWSVNESTQTMTVVKDLDDVIHTDINANLNYYPKVTGSDNHSSASIADYNQDGNIDIILTGALGNDLASAETTIFFWDVANENVVTYDDGNNFRNGAGRVSIGDIDNDGKLNANFVMDKRLISLDENFNLHWSFAILEVNSGFTGCSLYDFDGDGASEVVHRSEDQLFILSGEAGLTDAQRVRGSMPCRSRTQEEYPVIADVDGDGDIEICVACYFNSNTPFDPYRNTQFSNIQVFESGNNESWVSGRSIWNQHGYYNVNVNDDLTIPPQVQDPSVEFSSSGSCTDANGLTIPFASTPLNTFINQAPFLNSQGCVEFIAPDINLVRIIQADPIQCPDGTTDVVFEIANDGDADISGSLPVSYYAGDPTSNNSTLLDVRVEALQNFKSGDRLQITHSITAVGGSFELYVVINNTGSTPPISDPLPATSIYECKTDNNIKSIPVTTNPFKLQVVKLSDNIKCADDYLDNSGNRVLVPDNGTARVHYFGAVPGSRGVFWRENFEDLTIGNTNDSGISGWSATPTQTPSFFGVNLKNGSQMFESTNTGTANEQGIVTFTTEPIDISNHTDVSVSIDLFELGDMQTSGISRDFIRVEYELRDNGNNIRRSGRFANGEHYGNFGYQPTTLSNINSGGQDDSLLTIIVTSHTNRVSESHLIDNIQVSGTASQNQKEQTETDGFTFAWYAASDVNFTNVLNTTSTFSQMAEGDYTVIGEYNATSCFSDTVPITIDRQQPVLNVWAYEVTPETNCEIPNGSAAAFVYTSTLNGTFPASETNPPQDSLTSGYSFTWAFSGNPTPIASGSILSNVDGSSFDVEVIDRQTRCIGSITGVSIRSFTTSVVGVNVNEVDITACGGTGTLSADVGGKTADFTFNWYNGNSRKPNPDFVGDTYTVSAAGDYLLIVRNSLSCKSAEISANIQDLSNAPVLTVAETSPNTACGLNPTGVAQASVNGLVGQPGFDYTWYSGVNTLPQNEIPRGSSAATFGAGRWEMTQLLGGTYTVVVEDLATNCTDTTTVQITDNVIRPTFDLNNQVNTGSAIELRGQARIRFPQLFGPNNPITDKVTISFYGDLTTLNYDNDHRIFSSGGVGSNQTLLWSDDHKGLSFRVQTSDGSTARIDGYYSPIGWVQVTGTWDGATGEMKLYANGVLLGETNHTGSGILMDTGNPMYLGSDNDLNSRKFEGVIDELRIYDRVLSEFEIAAPVFTCAARNGTEQGLISYYNFDNINGTTVPDVSGSGNVGTIQPGTGSFNIPNADIECPVVGFEPNTSCGTLKNGVIDISSYISPASADYTFNLYDGISTNNLNTSNTTGRFEGLADGLYTITVENNITGCSTSPPATVEVEHIRDLPNIFTVVQKNTNCLGGNGSIAVTSSSNSDPSDNLTTYEYELYSGFNTDPVNRLFTQSVADGAIGAGFTGLSVGDYRVVVKNNRLECERFTDVVVEDDSDTPSFPPNQQINNNTSCNPTQPNGSVLVNILGGDVKDYTFSWWSGTDTSLTPLVDNVQGGTTKGEIIESRGAGDYTVVATNIATGCASVELTLTINDQPFAPVVVIEERGPDTSCGAGRSVFPGNGSLEAYVTTDPNSAGCTRCNLNYAFEWWYTNNGGQTFGPLNGNENLGNNSNVDFSNSIINNNRNTKNIISGLSSDLGNFVVTATHLDIGCSGTANAILSSTNLTPILTLANNSPNTACNSNNDGSFEVSITPPFLNGYTLQYYYSNGNQVINTGSISNSNPTSVMSRSIITGLPADDYKVVAIANSTNCASDTLTVSVTNSYIYPTGTVIEDQQSSSCLVGNGRAIADGDGAGTTNGFTFEWFLGSSPTIGNKLPGTADPSIFFVNDKEYHLGGMTPSTTYSVRITDNLKGCSIVRPITVSDNKQNPLAIDLTQVNLTHIASCDTSSRGSIVLSGVVNQSVAAVPYVQNGSFESPSMLNNPNTGVPNPSNGGIPYFFFGSASQPWAAYYEESLVPGWVTDDAWNVIELWRSGNPENSYIAYEGDQWAELNAQFQSALYFDANTIPDTKMIWRFAHRGRRTTDQMRLRIGPSTDLSQLQDQENPKVPGSFIFSSPTNSGDPALNGWTLYEGTYVVPVGQYSTRFQYESAGGIPTDGNYIDGIEFYIEPYTFNGYRNSTAGTPLASNSDGIFNGLEAGTYFFTVKNNLTGCESDPFPVTVDPFITPTFTIDVNLDKSDFGCSGRNTGEVTAGIGTIGSGGSVGYTLTWYSGTSTSGTRIQSVDNADLTISNLAGGFYTVEALDATTQCTKTATIEVTSQPLTFTPSVSSTDQTRCNLDDGTATVNNVSVTGNPIGQNPIYSYDWYLGNTQLIRIPFDNRSGTFEEGEIITMSGGATATIITFNGSGTILASDPSGNISDNETITGASSSATANVNSSVEITTSGTVGLSSLDNLASGTYSVFVTETQSGCVTPRVNVTVNDATGTLPTISFINIQNVSSCDASGGSLQGDIQGGTGPFTYRWYEGSADFTNDDGFLDALVDGQFLVSDQNRNSPISVNNTTPVLSNLISGIYTLVVETGNGCRTQASYYLPFNGIQTATAISLTNVIQCPDNGTAEVSLADFQELTVTRTGGDLLTLEPYTAVDNGGGSNAVGFISFDNGVDTIQISVESGAFFVGDEIVGTNSGNSATITAVNGVGYTNNDPDDIDEYMVYLYAGSGIPINRLNPYTITNSDGSLLTFPYSFDPDNGELRDGNGSIITSIATPGPITQGSSVTFTELPAGPYTAIAREKQSAPFGGGRECWTASASDQLTQEAYDPIITSSVVNENNFCVGNNGSIEVNVTKDQNDTILPDGYYFTWYDDSMPATIIFEEGKATANASSVTPATLGAGTYYVEIERTPGGAQGAGIGCSITSQTFTVIDNPEVHGIKTTSLSPNQNCNPPDGGIEITEINSNGTTINTFSNYRFNWYESDKSTRIHIIPYDNRSGTSPFTEGESITIDQTGDNITATIISDDGLNLYVSGLSGTISDNETIEGGSSGITASVNHPNGDITPTLGTIGASKIAGFPADTYYVSIKEHVNTGCPDTPVLFEVIIDDLTSIPVLQIISIADDSSCDNITPSGGATVDVIDNMGNALTVTDYRFSWYQSDGVTLISPANVGTGTNPAVGANANQASGLAENNYVVVAENITNNLGCLSIPLTITIGEFETNLTISNVNVTINPQDDCSPENGSITIGQVDLTNENGSITNSTTFTDFTFTWNDSNGTTVLTGNGENALLNQPSGTYTAAVVQNATGCPSTTPAIFTFTIDDQTLLPAINGTSTPNTFCSNATNTGDGSVVITITEDNGAPITLADYSIEWYRGVFNSAPGILDASFLYDDMGSASGANVGSSLVGPDIRTLQDLNSGSYTVFIAKDNGDASGNGNVGCAKSAVFTIGQNSATPTLDVTSIQSAITDDLLCGTFGGLITLADADISIGNLSDYTIEVAKDSSGTTVFGPATGTSPTTSIPNLEAGHYTVEAVNNTTSCATALGRVTIDNLEVDPLITLNSVTPDVNCTGGTLATGGLEVLVDGVSMGASYTFDWKVAGGGAGAPTLSTTNELINRQTGDYQVTIENTSTSCSSTRIFTIPRVSITPTILDYEVNNNSFCSLAKNGSFVLLEALYNGDSYNETGVNGLTIDGVFDLQVFRTSNDVQQGNTITNSPYEVVDLPPNNYYAIITHRANNCTSEALSFNIEDVPSFPVITIDINEADSTCATPNGTTILSDGTLSALANGEDSTSPEYTFSWYLGSGTGTPLVDNTNPGNGSLPQDVATSVVSGLAADTYTVRVEQVSNGCSATAEIILPNVSAKVEIVSVDVTAMTNCTLGGIIDVTGVEKDNAPDQLTNYTFNFYDDAATNNLVFTGTPFNGAQGGTTYYIEGTHNTLKCLTQKYQVTVGDNSISPRVSLSSDNFSTNQLNCNPDNPNGQLKVFADGDSTGYNFDWSYSQDGASFSTLTQNSFRGAVTTLTGLGTHKLAGLGKGFYRVTATSQVTGCASSEEFSIIDEIPTINLSPSFESNINCVNVVGKANVRVIGTSQVSGNSSLYDFYWFEGTMTTVGQNLDTTAARSRGVEIKDVPNGDYVVVVIPKNDRFCRSSVQITIEDETNAGDIPYTLDLDNSTVCYDVKNGSASLTLTDPDDIGNTSIEWQDENGNQIGSLNTKSEFVIDSLSFGTYRVIITDNNTLCETTEVFTISDDSKPPSKPLVQVINNKTNCVIPNGVAIARVDGTTFNMSFDWYDPSDMTTPLFSGDSISNLDSITYVVRATDISTGCASEFTQVKILNEISDPVFEVVVNRSRCLRTEDGSTNQFTGGATVSFAEFIDQSLTSYQWTNIETNEIVSDGQRLDFASPGNYAVTFISDNGCEYYAEFEIGVEIEIYNGISANGDGINDFFLIDCSDQYPANNVKIFNRAGQKVFDANSYNNTSTRFEGLSNVGGGGLTLPEGTYFYLVNLGTGEDPIQGYLELVR